MYIFLSNTLFGSMLLTQVTFAALLYTVLILSYNYITPVCLFPQIAQVEAVLMQSVDEKFTNHQRSMVTVISPYKTLLFDMYYLI